MSEGLSVPARERVLGEWVSPGLLRPRAPLHLNELAIAKSVQEIVDGLKRKPSIWIEMYALVGEVLADEVVAHVLKKPARRDLRWAVAPVAEWVSRRIDPECGGEPMRGYEARQTAVLAEWLRNHANGGISGVEAVLAAKALLFAGLLFVGSEADDWLALAAKIISGVQGDEFLSDGGHRSLSPMIHGLILESLLDCTNLSRKYPRRYPEGLRLELVDRIPVMAGWMRRLSRQDGSLANFHDATLGVSAWPGELVRYAESLGSMPVHRRGDDGFVRLECRDSLVLFDTNPFADRAWHHHAMLSFELSHRGVQIISNPGISTIADGKMQQIERATNAHACLEVDGLNQSDPGTIFRKAKYAKRVFLETDHQSWAEAAHDGYTRLPDPVVHRRRIEIEPKFVRIKDTLQGAGIHRVAIYFPFHPNSKCNLVADPKVSLAEVEAKYCETLRRCRATISAVCRWEGRCPVEFETLIPMED